MKHTHPENNKQGRYCVRQVEKVVLKSTATEVVEVIRNRPPLHTCIGTARSAADMFKQGPRSKSHTVDHYKLIDEVKEALLTGLPTDVMVQKFDLDKKYNIRKTGRKTLQ